jgi:UDP-GlcNAc3NAcA epimerase
MLKILTVIGARPQFIKASAVSRLIARDYAGRIEEKLLHTGQHFDENMSDVFFAELAIPEPAFHLDICSGSHGAMTGRMLEGIERVLLQELPDRVLVYGDTTSTLAGALAAVKLQIPVADVEAGLRSFNMRMPEEINRILTDRISDLLFCPTDVAVDNLRSEGLRERVHLVGDVMYDVALRYAEQARRESRILQRLGLKKGQFILVTCHRAENTDDRARLENIVKALRDAAKETAIVFPMHPRTRKCLENYGLLENLGGVTVIAPLAYLDVVALQMAAQAVCTDSGGMQKEAFFFGVPCITLRDETEWVELVDAGWNELVGADPNRIAEAISAVGRDRPARPPLYGDGNAAGKIVEYLATATAGGGS